MGKQWAAFLLVVVGVIPSAASAATARCVANPKDLHTTWASIFETALPAEEVNRRWSAYATTQYQALVANCIVTTSEEANAIRDDAAKRGWSLTIVNWTPDSIIVPVDTAAALPPPQSAVVPASTPFAAPAVPAPAPLPPTLPPPLPRAPIAAAPAPQPPPASIAVPPIPVATTASTAAVAVPANAQAAAVYQQILQRDQNLQQQQRSREDAFRLQMEEHQRQTAAADAARRQYEDRLKQYDAQKAAYDAQIQSMKAQPSR